MQLSTTAALLYMNSEIKTTWVLVQKMNIKVNADVQYTTLVKLMTSHNDLKVKTIRTSKLNITSTKKAGYQLLSEEYSEIAQNIY